MVLENTVTGLLKMTALLMLTGPSDELQQGCLSSADSFLPGYTKGIMPFQSQIVCMQVIILNIQGVI